MSCDDLLVRADDSSRVVSAMTKRLGFELISYGLLLAGLSYLTHKLAPSATLTVLVIGLAGGSLSIVWGSLIVRGFRGQAGPLLTLVPIAYVMLSQAILTWGGRDGGGSGSPLASVGVVFMLALTLAVVIRVAYTGATFDGLNDPAKQGNRLASSPTGGPVAPTQVRRAE